MFSHVWEGNEPLFQDVTAVGLVWDLDPSPLNEKLRKFCEVVRDDEENYRWAWGDTCCIDKTTSTMLNEHVYVQVVRRLRGDACKSCISIINWRPHQVPVDDAVMDPKSFVFTIVIESRTSVKFAGTLQDHAGASNCHTPLFRHYCDVPSRRSHCTREVTTRFDAQCNHRRRQGTR